MAGAIGEIIMILKIFTTCLMIGSLTILTFHAKTAHSAESVMKIMRAPLDETENLLHNGNFEQTQGDGFNNWHPWKKIIG